MRYLGCSIAIPLSDLNVGVASIYSGLILVETIYIELLKKIIFIFNCGNEVDDIKKNITWNVLTTPSSGLYIPINPFGSLTARRAFSSERSFFSVFWGDIDQDRL